MVEPASLAIVRSIELGEISLATGVDQSANDIITLMEGLMVLAKSRRNLDLLRELGPTMRRLLTGDRTRSR